jgi:uncharacterized protein YjdB
MDPLLSIRRRRVLSVCVLGCAMTGLTRSMTLALAAVVALIAACETTSPRPTIGAVLLAPDTATISIGQSVRIVATVNTNPNGSAFDLAWATSDPSKATVDSTGLIHGISAGQVSICVTATSGGGNSSVKSCASLTVYPNPLCPGPDGQLVPSIDSMHVGDVAQFQIPAAQMTGRTAGEIRWSVDNPAPAKIDSLSGVVTAVSPGSTNVIATDPLVGSPCPHLWRAMVLVH